MPNIASVKKDVKKSRENHLRNVAAKSAMKTFTKRARNAIDTGDITAQSTVVAVQQACKVIDKNAERGIIHKNQASRRKSRLMKRANRVADMASQGGNTMTIKASDTDHAKARQELSVAFERLLIDVEPELGRMTGDRKELVKGLMQLTDQWAQTEQANTTVQDREQLDKLADQLQTKSARIARRVAKRSEQTTE